MPTEQQEIEFVELLKRNNDTINRVCIRFCNDNPFYFEELRQECTLAIWTEYSRYGLSRFRGDSAESTWIYQISYHAAIHYLFNPKQKNFQSIEYETQDNSTHPTGATNLYGTEIIVNNEDNSDWNHLDELTEQLNSRERKLLEHYLNDHAYSTIAEMEGITEANVRKRMSRLLSKLKRLIKNSQI
ncbi:MAG: sigma-70 family RNA polymerase sigma factor [Bacteroidales bacterium]|nr:sigma-70 family RNA polymerase sigma factor [Bacteroidales bacterium]